MKKLNYNLITLFLLVFFLPQICMADDFSETQMTNTVNHTYWKNEHSSSVSDQICEVDSTVLPYNSRIESISFLNDEHYGTPSYRDRTDWLSLGPNGGYGAALEMDPQNPEILYVGTYSGGGVFKTTDGGNSWNSIGLCTGYIMSIAINPQTPSTIYGGSYWGNEGTFKSTDGGTNWTQHSVDNLNIRGLAVDPLNPSIMYAGTYASNYDGVYKSTDGGESWFQTGLDFAVVYDIVIDPQTPTNLYATVHIPDPTRFYLYKSTDGGDTWTQTDLAIRADCIAIHPDDASIIYAATWSGVYKSTDFGESWARIGLAGVSLMSIAIDPISPSNLYVGRLDAGIYKSTDGGSSWTVIGLAGADVRAIVIHPLSPDILYAATFRGNDSAVYKSTDAGASWNPINNGLTNFYSYAVAVAPSMPTVIYAGTNEHHGFYKSTDGGSTWFLSGLTDQWYIMDVVVHPDSFSIVYAVASYGGEGAFKSTDAGASWSTINIGMGSIDIHDLEMNPSDPSELYVGTIAGVYHSTNGGALWQYTGLSGYDQITDVAIDPNQTSTIYAGTTGDGMFKSTDGGGSWIGINNGLSIPQIRAIAIDPVTTTTLYVGTYGVMGGNGGGLFKSTDGGTSWNLVGLSDLRVVSLAISPSSPTTVYAGTRALHFGEGKGMYRSIDGGITWNEWNEGLTSEAVMALDISGDNILFAATNGTSIYSHSIEEILIGDFNFDDYVNAADLQLLGDHWHFVDTDPGWDALYDLVPDGIIDAADLQVFGDHWHEGTPPRSGQGGRNDRGPNENAGIVFDLDATTTGNQNLTSIPSQPAGTYIRIDVYCIDVQNLDTYEFEVIYNPSEFEYVTSSATNPITYEGNILEANGGTALGWMVDTSTPGVLSIAYTLAGNDPLEAPEGDGLIADIVFQSLVDTYGTLSFGNVDFYDSSGVMDIITDKGIAILYVFGNVDGTVTDSNTGEFIEGAIVSIENTTDITGYDGTYLLEYIPVGIYDINCTVEGYYDLTVEDVIVLENQTITVDFPISPIPPPNNLEASIVAYNDVHLEWQQPNPNRESSVLTRTQSEKLIIERVTRDAHASNESRDLLGYKVYRDNEVIYEITNPDELFYDDLSLTAAVYTYFVTAVYDAGESIPSNVETIEVILPAPQNPQAVTQEQDIMVTWDAPVVRVLSHYRVYRDLVLITDNIMDTSYLDENMPAGIYTYNITAVYNGGYESEMSPDAIINHESNDANGVLIPIKTKLYGNYPNPFNPTTFIQFEIKESETAELAIYNIKGQIVESKTFETGSYNYEWNSKDNASGVYFYKLSSESYSEFKKMILLK